eukprot:5300729-Pyramimonas_sp.AAC.1
MQELTERPPEHLAAPGPPWPDLGRGRASSAPRCAASLGPPGEEPTGRPKGGRTPDPRLP